MTVNGASLDNAMSYYQLIINIPAIICIVFLIYSIVLWSKYDKEIGILIMLILLNALYMPFYYKRIKRKIAESDNVSN